MKQHDTMFHQPARHKVECALLMRRYHTQFATYPFEVGRRQLQMQVRATRLNPMATCVKIVEQGGVPALYAGLIPSLLQL
ncbi:hypothetical protein HN51_005602 [Arachis hypogaea]